MTGLKNSKLKIRIIKYSFKLRYSFYRVYERVKIKERLFKAKKKTEKTAKKDKKLIVLRQFRDYVF